MYMRSTYELYRVHALYQLHKIYRVYELYRVHELHGVYELYKVHELYGVYELYRVHEQFVTHLACERASRGRCTAIWEDSGTTRGRKERLCGAMGVMRVPGTEGATMGPPADMLYAVDPEGVAIMRPSACVWGSHPRGHQGSQLTLSHGRAG